MKKKMHYLFNLRFLK